MAPDFGSDSSSRRYTNPTNGQCTCTLRHRPIMSPTTGTMIATPANGFRLSFLRDHRPCKCRHASSSTVRNRRAQCRFPSRWRSAPTLPARRHIPRPQAIGRRPDSQERPAPPDERSFSRHSPGRRHFSASVISRVHARPQLRYESCRRSRRSRQPSRSISEP
jgi:hypothetical protein